MLKSFLFALAAATLLLSGCAGNEKKKMLSEDIEVLTVFANEISVLKNPRLLTTSKEKYLAAKRLAEGVDFSLTRSVETLEQIFLVKDALTTRSIEYGDEIAFYYRYQDKYVRFRFWRTKNAVSDSEVRIK
ncbi:MAG: hypothetical protein IKA65_06855 [Lentisphaeria bacterium]|nr:hypothetical protein [Lentisphaeria bacterium]